MENAGLNDLYRVLKKLDNKLSAIIHLKKIELLRAGLIKDSELEHLSKELSEIYKQQH